MKYQFIVTHHGEYPVARMCRVLGVARSDYNAGRVCPVSQRQHTNQVLTGYIKALFEKSQQTYGSRRMRMALRATGIRCGREHIRRLMRLAGLNVPLKRKRS